MYDFGSNETLLEASSPTVFGNLRPQLDCEYVVDVIPSSSGLEAIMGAGSHRYVENIEVPTGGYILMCSFTSKKNLDLIPLRLMDRWSLDPSQAIRLPGAHGDEVVRSMCFNHEVCCFPSLRSSRRHPGRMKFYSHDVLTCHRRKRFLLQAKTALSKHGGHLPPNMNKTKTSNQTLRGRKRRKRKT